MYVFPVQLGRSSLWKRVKPQLDTTTRMRGSKAAVNMALWPPSEWPMQPMRSPSTSGSD
jgi:hypothetical protein